MHPAEIPPMIPVDLLEGEYPSPKENSNIPNKFLMEL